MKFILNQCYNSVLIIHINYVSWIHYKYLKSFKIKFPGSFYGKLTVAFIDSKINVHWLFLFFSSSLLSKDGFVNKEIGK